MSQCEDCGLVDPPDTHTCQQYEDRIKAERSAMTVEELLTEFEQRLEELERHVIRISLEIAQSRPWGRP